MIYQPGTKVKIVSLTPYDIQFHPELNVGDVGTVVSANEFFTDIFEVEFNGEKYNMEYSQLTQVKEEE